MGIFVDMPEVKSFFKSPLARALCLLFSSLSLVILCVYIFSGVLGFELPKTILIKRNNAEWVSKIDVLNRKMDLAESALEDLRLKDDDIYRSIFGLNQIPVSVRRSGLGGASRYDEYDEPGMVGGLKNTTMRVDNLLKEAYVQSTSFDQVASEAKKAGAMASCIPAIPPVAPDKRKVKLSSPFGFRADPISGETRRHTGYDFACKPGNPIYATGDGVVESVSFDFFNYGNSVVINHGFGYKTRYAHMTLINVAEGMIVKRGDCLGTSGNTGKSTGPHVHYEVMYKGNYVNPYPFFDMDMSLDEYMALVHKREQESNLVLGMGPRVKKRK